MQYTLGISAYYHDSAAALLGDGEILAAAQEERFTRIKGDAGFPHKSIAYCLGAANIDLDDVEQIVFYENPLEKFGRLLQSHLAVAPRSLRGFLAAMPKWLSKNLWLEKELCREMGISRRIQFCDHHLSHAASAFFPSPYEKAAILTVDGAGEWSTSTVGKGEGNQITLLEEQRFPNSLGLLYSAFTYFTGFKINSGEYKLMGLAPYGKPIYKDIISRELLTIDQHGSITLNQRYFNYVEGLTMTSQAFADLFGGPPRKPETPISQREMDLAASIQAVTEDAILVMAGHAREVTGLPNLVMAGGVALNVVACGRLAREKIFDQIWVQPASGDAGGAVGAAMWHWHMEQNKPRTVKAEDNMHGAFLGPSIDPGNIDETDAWQNKYIILI